MSCELTSDNWWIIVGALVLTLSFWILLFGSIFDGIWTDIWNALKGNDEGS